MGSSRTRRLATEASLFVTATLTLAAAPAYAFETRVSAAHDAQFYEVRSPFGSPELLRRRHTSTLGLELTELEWLGEQAPRLDFKSRLRLDADFGQEQAERDPASDRFVPGLEQTPLDLMYAYLEARGLWNGALDVRLGRQLFVDGLGFWALDGARLLLNLPYRLALGAYGGVEPRPGLPMLATARYTADGVSRGDRSGLEDNEAPSFLDESKLAPAYGAWLGVNALGPLSAAVAYRKVENRSRVRLSPFARDPSEAPATFGEPRTSSERVATTARLDWPGRGSLSSNAVYDRYRSLWTELVLGADVVPTGSVSLGAEFSRRRPVFDGDSIFNWFSQGTTTAATTRVSIAPTRWFDASLSSGVGWFETEGDPWAAPGATARDLDRSGHNLTGSVAARLRDGVGELSLSARGDAGDRGHLAGADLSARRSLGGGVYDVLTLLSLYDWSDPLRPDRDATSFSYVLAGGARTGVGLFSRSRLGLEWEHTLNRLVSQRFRVLATLRLEVFR